MEVICLQDAAFYALIEEVVARIKDQQNIKSEKWISGEETMKMLRITSKTTLQKLRDEGKIRLSQPEKRTFKKLLLLMKEKMKGVILFFLAFLP